MKFLPYKRIDEETGEPYLMKPVSAKPKSSWTFADLKKDTMQKLKIDQSSGATLVFASVKYGKIKTVWKDSDQIQNVDPKDDIIVYEMFIEDKNDIIIELDFY